MGKRLHQFLIYCTLASITFTFFSIVVSSDDALNISTSTSPSFESMTGSANTVLFSDDFNYGISPLWTDVTGAVPGNCNWSVIDGAYNTLQNGINQLCLKSAWNSSWSDYVYEVDIRGNDGVNKEIIFRVWDGLNTYALNIISAPTNQVHLNKIINGSSTNLAIATYNSEINIWYHVKIVCVHASFTVFIDDNQVLSVHDYNNPILSGGIGLVNWTGATGVCDVSFDNVILTGPRPGSEGDTFAMPTIPAIPGIDVVLPIEYASVCALHDISFTLSWTTNDLVLDYILPSGYIPFSNIREATIDNNTRTFTFHAGSFSEPLPSSSGTLCYLHFHVENNISTGFYLFNFMGTPVYNKDCGGGQELNVPLILGGGIVVDESTNSVSGYVVDNQGNPLDGASVNLWDTYNSGSILQSKLTGSNGSFFFTDITSTPVDIYTHHDSYYSKLIDNISIPQSGIMINLEEYNLVTPTNEWVTFYCQGPTTLNGQNLPYGSVVEAFDPDGVICGRSYVVSGSEYGGLDVFRDDPLTPEDEGAEPGDIITFYIIEYGTWDRYIASPSTTPVWTQNGDLHQVCLHAIDPTFDIDPPAYISVSDPGTGTDLVVRWQQGNTIGVTGYGIYAGSDPGSLTLQHIFSPATVSNEDSTVISYLVENQPYYIAVRSLNSYFDLYSEFAFPDQNIAYYPTIPVVLVHGWKNGSPETWDTPGSTNDFAGWLGNHHLSHIWIASYYNCGPEGEVFFNSNAGVLASYVFQKAYNLEQATGLTINEVNIVAHSMGGLVSRRMIATPEEFNLSHVRVKNLIMLWTPNGGTKYGNLACYEVGEEASYLVCPGPAGCELSSGMMQDFNDIYEWERNGTIFSAVAGNACCGHKYLGKCSDWYCNIATFEEKNHDGIVPVNSVFDIYFNNQYIRSLEHSELTSTPLICDDIVAPIIKGLPPVSDNYYYHEKVLEQSNEQLVFKEFIPMDSDIVTSIDIEIEPAEVMNIWAYAYSSDMAASLIDPNGITIDSALALSNPDQYIYKHLDGIVSFSIFAPSNGMWQLDIQPYALNDSIAPIIIAVTIETETVMNFNVDSSLVELNEPVLLTATLLDGNTPLTNATVSVDLFHDSLSSSQNVVLYDNGTQGDQIASDGIYSFLYSNTLYHGSYYVSCNASGENLSSEPFERFDVATFYVQSSCCQGQTGNINNDLTNQLDISDLLYLVDYFFAEPPGPAPVCIDEADANGSGLLDISDLLYLVDYFFLVPPGPAPLDCL